MIVNIVPSPLVGSISAPASKSYAHRWVIAAFLSEKPCVIRGAGSSVDVRATVGVLNAMGGDVRQVGGDVHVGIRRTVNAQITANCLESGSTLRFMFPLAGALDVDVEFTGAPRLMVRPMDALNRCLSKNGVEISGHTTKGALRAGDYEIDGGISSQYVTGLLLALPLLDGDSRIIIKGEMVSKGYVDVTLDVLARCGVRVDAMQYGYFVPGNQTYNCPDVVDVEGDWSGAAFMLTAGAVGGDVTLSGLREKSSQGDRQILDVLRRMGAVIEADDEHVRVSASALRAIEYDCQNIPDLVQVMSVACAFAQGTSVLKNVGRLRIKESDRVVAITEMLSRAGIKSWCDDKDLYVVGGTPTGADFDGGNDHRTVMSTAILANFAQGQSCITGAEVVDKSYPDFFRDFVALGGKVNG